MWWSAGGEWKLRLSEIRLLYTTDIFQFFKNKFLVFSNNFRTKNNPAPEPIFEERGAAVDF